MSNTKTVEAGERTQPNPVYRAQWQTWRNHLDRITSRPDYRYGHKHAPLLLKLAAFCMTQMAHFNNLAWGKAEKGAQ